MDGVFFDIQATNLWIETSSVSRTPNNRKKSLTTTLILNIKINIVF